jgi:hypothetical protein
LDTLQNCKIWRTPSCEMWHRVALVRTNVSEERTASNIRVTRIGEIGTTLGVTSNWSMLQRKIWSFHGGVYEEFSVEYFHSTLLTPSFLWSEILLVSALIILQFVSSYPHCSPGLASVAWIFLRIALNFGLLVLYCSPDFDCMY